MSQQADTVADRVTTVTFSPTPSGRILCDRCDDVNAPAHNAAVTDAVLLSDQLV